jgi:TRAP-type C4-dicarboxylate transport system permease large subunit
MKLRDTKFAFLTSVRFWKLVTIGFIQVLVTIGAFSASEAQAIAQIVQVILGGDITIATIDRFAERSGGSNTGN